MRSVIFVAMLEEPVTSWNRELDDSAVETSHLVLGTSRDFSHRTAINDNALLTSLDREITSSLLSGRFLLINRSPGNLEREMAKVSTRIFSKQDSFLLFYHHRLISSSLEKERSQWSGQRDLLSRRGSSIFHNSPLRIFFLSRRKKILRCWHRVNFLASFASLRKAIGHLSTKQINGHAPPSTPRHYYRWWYLKVIDIPPFYRPPIPFFHINESQMIRATLSRGTGSRSSSSRDENRRVKRTRFDNSLRSMIYLQSYFPTISSRGTMLGLYL